MKKLGRPRKTIRKENISVNLYPSTIDKINDKLSWNSSRSEWIEDAIKRKLDDGTIDLSHVKSITLLSVLSNRDDVNEFVKRACDLEMKNILQQQIKELE